MIQQISKAFQQFLRSQQFSGVLLLLCAAVSLTLANSEWGDKYLNLLNQNISFGFGDNIKSISLEHFVNDVLMAFFFLLVGLEIKREIVSGELSSFQKASLPVAAALGGMIFPAIIYSIFNSNSDTSHGWAIPMATDIAFSLGILSLLGNRVPLSLKLILTALAVVDDLGAVLVIALFYTKQLHTEYLMYAGGVLLLLYLFPILKVRSISIFLLAGVALWYFIYCSGIHATVSGVLLAFAIPYNKNDEDNCLLRRLEHILHTPVNQFIMPLFALVNTAIIIEGNLITSITGSIGLGVILGLVLGKTLGILTFSSLAVKLKIATADDSLNWKHFTGLGLLAGIGFTMSIFISLLSFDHPQFVNDAKLSIIAASCVAGIAGYFMLKFALSSAEKKPA